MMPKPNTGIIQSWICAPCGGCGRRKGENDKGPTETVGDGGFEVAMVSQHTKTIRKDYGF